MGGSALSQVSHCHSIYPNTAFVLFKVFYCFSPGWLGAVSGVLLMITVMILSCSGFLTEAYWHGSLWSQMSQVCFLGCILIQGVSLLLTSVDPHFLNVLQPLMEWLSAILGFSLLLTHWLCIVQAVPLKFTVAFVCCTRFLTTTQWGGWAFS